MDTGDKNSWRDMLEAYMDNSYIIYISTDWLGFRQEQGSKKRPPLSLLSGPPRTVPHSHPDVCDNVHINNFSIYQTL